MLHCNLNSHKPEPKKKMCSSFCARSARNAKCHFVTMHVIARVSLARFPLSAPLFPMAPKPKNSREAEIAALKATIAQQDQQLVSQGKELGPRTPPRPWHALTTTVPTETLKTSGRRNDMIKKPPGSASRSPEEGGYNICEKMGLVQDKKHYNRIVVRLSQT